MRISALFISLIVVLASGILSVTCTAQSPIAEVAPVSVRVRSVPPKAIVVTTGGGRGGGGRYSSRSSGGK